MSAKKSDAERAFDLWCSLNIEGREEFAKLRGMYDKVVAQTSAAKPRAKKAARQPKPQTTETATA